MPPPTPPRGRPAPPAEIQADAIEFCMDAPEWKVPRMVLIAEPGFGKTTFFANAPNAALIMTPNELGYETLLGNGLVPNIPRIKPATWGALLSTAQALTRSCPYSHIGVDAAGGMVQLCIDHVVDTVFGGDRGEKGYASFGKGTDATVREMTKLLDAFEVIANNGTSVTILAHETMKTKRNPSGADYDRLVADMQPKVWALVKRWANVVLYGSFELVIDKDSKKAAGGKVRQILTENTAGAEAKNQYGLLDVIKFLNPQGGHLGPDQMWDHIYSRMKGHN